MNLADTIIKRIKDNGPLSFETFMEMCLYCPELGYYNSPRQKIGKNGDFYTSAYLTPIFGAMIGKQLEEMWGILGSTAFTIVEYGAGTGMLCRDILQYLKHNEKMYDQLSYWIIEKSPVMREIEKEHLTEKVSWCDSIAEIPKFNGCILSNELVDNFAVHQVIMGEELMQVFVDFNDRFTEVLQPASPILKHYFKELKVNLPKGFRTEINLQATNWIAEISAALNSGYILTIDYGYLSSDLYKSCRSEGTLLCYHNHTINDSLYDHPGEQDITSHVNFSALIHWGEQNGLTTQGFTDQGRFLLAMGFTEFLHRSFSNETDIAQAARKASALSHTLLYDMGTKFKFLIQEKGAGRQKLSGMRIY